MINLINSAWESREYLRLIFVLATVSTYLSFIAVWMLKFAIVYNRETREDRGLVRCLVKFIRESLYLTLKLAVVSYVIYNIYWHIASIAGQFTKLGALLILLIGAVVIEWLCYTVLGSIQCLRCELLSLIQFIRLGLFTPKSKESVKEN